jgi:LysR family transcriptional regulator, hca operon transcriptional activator
MELRHLRYFIAVADAGSLTVAAEQKLHTSQPSLSRQIRDLEQEVGVQLINRSAHGIELTSAGKAFLDHARAALLQAEAAKEAALRSAHLARPTFALGFLSGSEIGLLPEVSRILRKDFPGIEIRLSSDYSPALAKALMRGKLEAAFMRLEEHMGDLAFRRVRTDPLIFVFPWRRKRSRTKLSSSLPTRRQRCAVSFWSFSPRWASISSRNMKCIMSSMQYQ